MGVTWLLDRGSTTPGRGLAVMVVVAVKAQIEAACSICISSLLSQRLCAVCESLWGQKGWEAGWARPSLFRGLLESLHACGGGSATVEDGIVREYEGMCLDSQK